MKAMILTALASAVLTSIVALAIIVPQNAQSRQLQPLTSLGPQGPLVAIGAGSTAWFLDVGRSVVIGCASSGGAIQCTKTSIP